MSFSVARSGGEGVRARSSAYWHNLLCPCSFVLASSSLVLLLSAGVCGQNANAESQQLDASSAPQPIVTTPAPSIAPRTPTPTNEDAWEALDNGCASKSSSERAHAVSALALLQKNARARRMAEAALLDRKPEVRSAAATALGEMNATKSIPKLRKALDDNEPSVALAAAHALYLMHDRASYQLYYEVLTKEKKGGKGLIASQMELLNDPKKIAALGFQQGMDFVPFGGIGWTVIKDVRKDDSSPIRAASARMLAQDPDPETTKVLAQEAGDKSWIVRSAAIEALARRGDPSALDTVALYIMDEKDVVRYMAAAATIRLSGIRQAKEQSRKQR